MASGIKWIVMYVVCFQVCIYDEESLRNDSQNGESGRGSLKVEDNLINELKQYCFERMPN